ncbi:MAG: hypothetical protein LBT59_31115 [Clostridiales bacterium]|jgi:hypothetical protein|nr:hypothetical protein [Clostridiales bacterium]
MFKKRLDKLIDVNETEQKAETIKDELEKGDLPAILLAAFLTLWPCIIFAIGMLLLLYFFVLSRA